MESVPLLGFLRSLRGGVVRYVHTVASTQPFAAAQRVFRTLLLLWLLLHTSLLLPFHGEVFGPDALVERAQPRTSLEWCLSFAVAPALQDAYLFVLGAQLLSILIALTRWRPRLTLIPVYVLTMNVNALAGVVLDGGNNLVQLLLFYMLFVDTRPEQLATKNSVSCSLSNLAFFLVRLQVVIVYATAALYKVNGHLWQNGMALYYVLQAETYTHPAVVRLVYDYPWIATLATYFTVALQCSLPFLIWVRATRPFVVLAGIGLHLGISFVMGLLTFGLVMCVSYSAFLSSGTATRLLRAFGSDVLHVEHDGSRWRRWVLSVLGSVGLGRLRILSSRATTGVTAWSEDGGKTARGAAAWALALCKVPWTVPLGLVLGALYFLGVPQLLETSRATLADEGAAG